MAEPVGGRITSWLVLVLIIGCQKAALLNSDGGKVQPRRVEQIAIQRILAPPADALSGSGEATSSSESTSTSVVVRGVPRDLGGNTAGEVVRQASDDDRDGGDVLGRLATHGQYGVVLAAPGPVGTFGELLG